MWTGQNITAQMPTLCWPKRAPLMDTTRGTLCVALDAGLQCRSVRPCHPKGSEALVFVLVPSLQLKHNASPHFFFLPNHPFVNRDINVKKKNIKSELIIFGRGI